MNLEVDFSPMVGDIYVKTVENKPILFSVTKIEDKNVHIFYMNTLDTDIVSLDCMIADRVTFAIDIVWRRPKCVREPT